MSRPTTRLSTQERRVLERIKKGMTTQQIADDMDLGYETIHSYRKRILAKAGASSMAQAVAVISARGEEG